MFLPRRITNDRDFRISDSLQSQFPNGHHSQAASLCHKEVPENTEKQVMSAVYTNWLIYHQNNPLVTQYKKRGVKGQGQMFNKCGHVAGEEKLELSF